MNPCCRFLRSLTWGHHSFDYLLLSVTMLLPLCRHLPVTVRFSYTAPNFTAPSPTLPSPCHHGHSLYSAWNVILQPGCLSVLSLSWCLLCPSWTQTVPVSSSFHVTLSFKCWIAGVLRPGSCYACTPPHLPASLIIHARPSYWILSSSLSSGSLSERLSLEWMTSHTLQALIPVLVIPPIHI